MDTIETWNIEMLKKTRKNNIMPGKCREDCTSKAIWNQRIRENKKRNNILPARPKSRNSWIAPPSFPHTKIPGIILFCFVFPYSPPLSGMAPGKRQNPMTDMLKKETNSKPARPNSRDLCWWWCPQKSFCMPLPLPLPQPGLMSMIATLKVFR